MLCSVTDGDLPLSLAWFREGKPLRKGPRGSGASAGAGGVSITEIGDFESVLRIDDLRPEHNANFTCRAENLAGVASHSQTIRVKG